MKIKVVIVILAVACLGLAIALYMTKNQSDEQHSADSSSISSFSNQLVAANENLKNIGQVNLTLSNDLASSEQQVALTASQVAQLSNSLAEASSALADTKSSLVSAEDMVTNLNNRISDLEAQNKVLDDQASSLSNQLAQLTAQIEDTKTQLAISQTNAAFLKGALQKELAQRAELEHKFNDLDELRVQVRKIKDEMFVARRLELMKNDNGDKKGATLLMMHRAPAFGPAQPATTATAHPSTQKPGTSPYDLNVEVGSDGSVKVIPPLGSTNTPSH